MEQVAIIESQHVQRLAEMPMKRSIAQMTLHSRSRLQTSIASVLLVLDKILDCCIDVQPLLPILIISDVVVHFETLLVEEEAFLLL